MTNTMKEASSDSAPSGTDDVDILVVGGGQAALAVGYYLQRAQRRRNRASPTFALLDAGSQPGGAWNSGWDTLQLFSPAGYSSLPGWPMPRAEGPANPSAGHVQRYLAAYEKRYDLPVHRPVRVLSVAAEPGGTFLVITDHAGWRCRVLINATGTWGRPFWPAYPGMDDYRGRQLHTVDYRTSGDFEGQRVLVVGGGNSGAQITADLSGRRAGSTTWVTRRPPRFLPDDVDGRRLFEIATRRVRALTGGDHGAPDGGVGGLGDIVMVPPVLHARRRGALDAAPMFDRLSPTGAAWDSPPESLDADAVIWCTGFRPDLRHLSKLDLTRRHGIPLTDPGSPYQSVDNPRLFFLGYGDWSGPASATLIGVGAQARNAVDAALDSFEDTY